MSKEELKKLRKAVRNMKKENDTFYIKGEYFFCRWTGKGFSWTVHGRTYENCTVKEILEWIADGSGIESYCYDYGNYTDEELAEF